VLVVYNAKKQYVVLRSERGGKINENPTGKGISGYLIFTHINNSLFLLLLLFYNYQ